MFEKKCKRCRREIKRDFGFCPFCGFDVKKEQEGKDYGFLGKDDNLDLHNFGVKMPFGFDMVFSNLLKQIDKQFKELDKEIGQEAKKEKVIRKKLPSFSRGLSISISTSTGKKPEIKISGFGPGLENLSGGIKELGKKEEKIKAPEITEEKAREIAKLPREEAKTSVRRLSNKIIYEISLSGVSNLKDVLINKLENSIEIKAFSKDKVYFKLLPINLPILTYKLKDNKLILELKAK